MLADDGCSNDNGATKKQQLRASGALFRVYNATVMVGDVSGDGW